MVGEAVSMGTARIKINVIPAPRGEGALWSNEVGSMLRKGEERRAQTMEKEGEGREGSGRKPTPLDTIMLRSRRE